MCNSRTAIRGDTADSKEAASKFAFTLVTSLFRNVTIACGTAPPSVLLLLLPPLLLVPVRSMDAASKLPSWCCEGQPGAMVAVNS
jgi:hypothetical protein